MQKIATKIGALAIVLFIAYFGLKGFIVTVWESPKEPITYSIHGSDGRSLILIFLPKHETLFLYTPDRGTSVEVSLTRMRGSYGTHFLWRIWSVESPSKSEGLFGYRLYPEGAKPVVMETTVLKKFVHGTAKPVLPKEGERTHPTILFFEDSIQFEGMSLTLEPTDTQFVQELLRKLKPQ